MTSPKATTDKARSKELQRLIEEQYREMHSSRQWPEPNCVSFNNLGLLLDQEGRSVREGMRGRLGDRLLPKFRTASYVPLRGCRKKLHGSEHMVTMPNGQRKCGPCRDEYDASRRTGQGHNRPRTKCTHGDRFRVQKLRNGKKWGTICTECAKERSREWRERKRNGTSSR
jgi:hypothetical protein